MLFSSALEALCLYGWWRTFARNVPFLWELCALELILCYIYHYHQKCTSVTSWILLCLTVAGLLEPDGLVSIFQTLTFSWDFLTHTHSLQRLCIMVRWTKTFRGRKRLVDERGLRRMADWFEPMVTLLFTTVVRRTASQNTQHNRSNLEADGLWRQKNTSGSTPVGQERVLLCLSRSAAG